MRLVQVDPELWIDADAVISVAHYPKKGDREKAMTTVELSKDGMKSTWNLYAWDFDDILNAIDGCYGLE